MADPANVVAPLLRQFADQIRDVALKQIQDVRTDLGSVVGRIDELEEELRRKPVPPQDVTTLAAAILSVYHPLAENPVHINDVALRLKRLETATEAVRAICRNVVNGG